jgi:PPOX class probable F420-dependent enzyme
MELADALSFVGGRRQAAVSTIRSSGRHQLSNIVYARGDDDVARVSVTDSRAKTKNLRRDPRASLFVVGDHFGSYVVLGAAAELTPVAADPAPRRSTNSSPSTGWWLASTPTGTSSDGTW